MNTSRSSTVTVSNKEIIAALKIAHPEIVDIIAIPENMTGVKVVTAEGVMTITTTRSTGVSIAVRH